MKFDFTATFGKLHAKVIFKMILVGANDGLSFDNLFQLLDPKKTNGLIIEPSPKYFEMLQYNLSHFVGLKFLNFALFKNRKSVSLFQLNNKGLNSLPEWGRGIGSFSKKHLLKFGIEEDCIEEIQVEGIPFMDVIKPFEEFKSIDYLQIDTEGYDAEIIKMIDFNNFKVKLIKFESANLKKDELSGLEELFLINDFNFFKGREDSFALHKSIKPIYK